MLNKKMIKVKDYLKDRTLDREPIMNEPKTTERNWSSIISQMFQFILGFLIGIALIAGSAVGAAYYYFTKVSSSVPEKPLYSEETANAPVAQQSEDENDTQLDIESLSNVDRPEPITEPVTESIPPNAYYANVTWSEGLSLRAEPNIDAERIGGVGYNARILILEESSDKRWQKIRIPGSEREGWVKAGNIKRVSE